MKAKYAPKRRHGGQAKDFSDWKKAGEADVVPGLKSKDVLPEFRKGYSRRNENITRKSW